MKKIIATLALLFLFPPVHAAASVTIERGAGSFTVAGGEGRENRPIEVHYYRPQTLSPTAPVLMVMPGAGRNGDDYRDAWKAAAERHGVLILSPAYSETHYPEYWSYNLGNMPATVTLDVTLQLDTNPSSWTLPETTAATADSELLDAIADESRLLSRMAVFALAGMLRDTDAAAVDLSVNTDRRAWIYSDFDRIFEIARQSLDLEATGYDLFGHSAGGQVLHRFALFHPENRANRIVAANSGWYTMAGFEEGFPYGLGNTGMNESEIAQAFGSKLVVFLGEKDDETETRGSLRKTPEANRQGPGRIQRGRYFFEAAREAANRMDAEFNWNLYIVPGVGHDYRRMAAAAADYLYGEECT